MIITELALGYNHVLAVNDRHELYGWGEGKALGIGVS